MRQTWAEVYSHGLAVALYIEHPLLLNNLARLGIAQHIEQCRHILVEGKVVGKALLGHRLVNIKVVLVLYAYLHTQRRTVLQIVSNTRGKRNRSKQQKQYIFNRYIHIVVCSLCLAFNDCLKAFVVLIYIEVGLGSCSATQLVVGASIADVYVEVAMQL